MKRVFLSILSILYLAIASGLVVNVHYCMGKQTELQYSNHSGKHCETCGMKNNEGCCHDEYKMIKLDLDQQLVKIQSVHFFQELIHQPCTGISLLQIQQGSAIPGSVQYHSPPDQRSTEVFQYNCNFRI
jgi:hypothetical protein